MTSRSPGTQQRGSWRREKSTVVLTEVDSPERIEPPFAIHAERAHVPVPLQFEPHSHPLHELVWVRGGTMTVQLKHLVLTVPQGHGVWLPAGLGHAGRMTANTLLCDALFDPERSRLQPAFLAGAPVAVHMSPVLESLLTHLEQADLSERARLNAEAVVFDVLAPAARQLALQVPSVGRLDPVVQALLDDPTDARGLGEWSEQLGLSERTMTRLFRSATGLSFQQWRQVLRVHHAVELLAEGLEVQEVAALLGYAQPSTFIASFKRVMGVTPGAFDADGRNAVSPGLEA
jgi:AraC-like DNA-binding protein